MSIQTSWSIKILAIGNGAIDNGRRRLHRKIPVIGKANLQYRGYLMVVIEAIRGHVIACCLELHIECVDVDGLFTAPVG
jgi:hypothetical protein